MARPRHPFEGRSLQVLGGMRRHGGLELLLVLPDGSKSLVPTGWTDADRSGVDGETAAATLGALTDLLWACEMVADLAEQRRAERGQAAGKSPCEEDFHAACPVQSNADPAPAPPALVPPAPARGLPAEAVAVATALLAGVIAKAAVPAGIEVAGDE